jgi:TolB protein
MADRVSGGCVAAVLLVLGVAAAASGGVGSAGGGTAANAEIVAVDLAGRQTNLTQNPAADVAPSVARDGRIAFLSTRDGLADLYVMNSRGENVRRLTSRAGITLGEDLEWSQASWAPDGQRIAFDAKYDTGVSDCTQRCASWKVMVVGADGSGPNEIMRDARAAAWSPNGRRLAYVGGVNAYGSADNVTLSRDDGSDPVSVSAHAGFSDVGPAWSPSGPGRVAG